MSEKTPKTPKDAKAEAEDTKTKATPDAAADSEQAQAASPPPPGVTAPTGGMSAALLRDPELAKVQGRVDTTIPAQIPDVYRVPMEHARDALNAYNSDDPSTLTAVTLAYEEMKAAATRWTREGASDLIREVSLYGTHWLERLQRTLEPRPPAIPAQPAQPGQVQLKPTPPELRTHVEGPGVEATTTTIGAPSKRPAQ